MTPLQADRFFQEPESLLLLGIVNITPDSFSDGGSYLNPEKAVQHALSLLDSGAGWLDLTKNRRQNRKITATYQI